MRGRVAKIIRKTTYPKGYDRETTYQIDEGGTVMATHERRLYKDLKKEYKGVSKNGQSR